MPNATKKNRLLAGLENAIAIGDEDVIYDASLAVGDGDVKHAVSTLLKLLTNDPRLRVKLGAAMSLRELGVDRAVPELIRSIENKEFRNNRGTFVYALGPLKWYTKHSHAVARLLTDDNFEVRSMAYQALTTALPRMTRDNKDEMFAALYASIVGKAVMKGMNSEAAEVAFDAALQLASPGMRRVLLKRSKDTLPEASADLILA